MGSQATAGGTHRYIISQVQETLESHGCSVELPGTENGTRQRTKPDILCEGGGEIFDTGRDVWIEAETSTIRKPAHIIDRFAAAVEHGAKPVFAVAAGKKGIGGNVRRLDRILGDPPLAKSRENGTLELYATSEKVPVSRDGEFVGHVALKEEWMDERGWHWEDGRVYYQTPEILPVGSPSNIDDLQPDDVPFVLETQGDSVEVSQYGEVIDTYEKGAHHGYVTPRKPVIPSQYDINVEEGLRDVEYLIVEEDGTVYQRPFASVTEIS